ncbi:MAG: hypothetical protein WKF37_23655 [Bryobacteraceae bacterium]
MGIEGRDCFIVSDRRASGAAADSIDNEWARVVVATSKPGPKGVLHKHVDNRVMVYLDKGMQRLEFVDGSKKDISFAAGEAKWDQKGDLHTSENLGGTVFRVVEIELKKSGGRIAWPAQDPAKVAPDSYKVEFENDQVRVLRVRFKGGQKIALHEHAVPRIAVPLTDIDLQLDGGPKRFRARPGEATFLKPAIHAEKNLLADPTELILVDLK